MSFLTSACMTELEAVNLMLGSIGESAVASLGDPLNSDALTAISCLSTSNRTIQSIGWFFNERFETWPRTVDGEIIVPLNALSVATTGVSKGIRAVRSNDKLYDVDNNTFVWTQAPDVQVIYIIPFEDLPQAARDYIVEDAGIRFQANSVGSEALYKFERDRMYQLRSLLMREQRRTSQPNMLTDSWSVARVQLGRMGGSVRIL
jgi:hypothetical protein